MSFDRKNLNNVYMMTKRVKVGIRTGSTVWWVQKIYFNPEEDNSHAIQKYNGIQILIW